MAKRTLAEQLPGPLPPGIDALSEEDKQRLADALRSARHQQAAALAAAGEEGLRYVPALLRGVVRKAVGL
ncbi:hypothetical protein [Amycolatopsis suaedae]|uniref:Uncharacterized protein n=1 Tax=Amycolatopsis suaedae TaxID=2510978 RepID=A0A4V2ELP0_9PSEU|nr:hypothetical protein [Amycolatopsis suaedae]RZQ62235.1 hypothetical protein EWH70_18280 [Amycolatopsis suaedae]